MSGFGKHVTVNNIVAIILAVIGLIWFIHSVWRNCKINRISAWPKAPAIVLNAVVEPINANAGNLYMDPKTIIPTTDKFTQYIPIIIYKYDVGNQTYQSDNIIYSGPRTYNAFDTKVLMGTMAAGSPITVYYNPNYPRESYIYNGVKNYLGIVVGLIFICVAIYLLYREQTNIGSGEETGMMRTDRTPSLTDVEPKVETTVLSKKTSKTSIKNPTSKNILRFNYNGFY